MKLKTNGYITPLQRKAIYFMLENNVTTCSSARKDFTLDKKGNEYTLTENFSEKDRLSCVRNEKGKLVPKKVYRKYQTRFSVM